MKHAPKNKPFPHHATAAPGPTLFSGSSWWLGGALCVVAVAAYWPALGGAFIWDDDGHLTRPELRSLGGLVRIWFELGATQQYYPVLHSAFWLEHFVFGDAAAGYHFLNVLLHATGACLFASVLRRLSVPGAWLAALLFALHPVCVESVAWISEQKNTLSTVFYLLAALAYLRFDRSRRPAHYIVASVLFFLALGTKTVTGTLPAALLVVFWWQRGRVDLRRDVAPLAPWFALAVIAAVLTAWVEHAIVGAEHNELALGLVQRVLLASRAVWFYAGKLVYPADLIFIYPRWTIDAGAAWQYLFPWGILLVVLAGWRWRRHRGPVAAALFFAGSLLPALGFVNVFPFLYSFVADHFQYLASLGLFALAGAGLEGRLARWPRLPASALTLGLLATLAVLTWRQCATYRDPTTLYEATLAKNPNAWLAHNNLANALAATGRVAEALPHYEAAQRLRPESAEIENNLGFAHIRRGDFDAAIPHLERALRLRPDYVFAYNNLGLALLSAGRFAEAEASLKVALRLKEEYPEAHLNLGLTFAQQGNSAEALRHFATAVRLRPAYTEAEFNWAIGLALANRFTEALAHFARAAHLAPERPDIQNAFGRTLDLDGRFDDAIIHYRAAVGLAPDFAEAHFNLARALRQTGRTEESAFHFAEATRLGWKK